MKSLLELPSKEFRDFIERMQDYQQTGRLTCTFWWNKNACFGKVLIHPYHVFLTILPICMSGDLGNGCGVPIEKAFDRDDTMDASLQLTPVQIDAVVDWMNTWEQLKVSSIPLRFKEDFNKGLQRGNPS